MKISFNPRTRWILGVVPVFLGLLIWRGDWSTVAVALTLWSATFVVALVAKIKLNFLRSLAPETPRETVLEDWPRLDRAAWDEIGAAWRELGFAPIATLARGQVSSPTGAAVSQLWQRPERDAIVEVSQHFLPQNTLPVATFVVSYWGDGEALQQQARALEISVAPLASPLGDQGFPQTAPPSERLPVYSYSTHNRAPNWIFGLLLHPQVMGTRKAGDAPGALWETHLARRTMVSQALQSAPLTDDLERVLRAQSRVLAAIWHRRLSRDFARQLWRARRRDISRTEVWGDLESRLRETSAPN